MTTLSEHVERFLNVHRSYQSWRRELVAIAPAVPADVRAALDATGALVQDLTSLTHGLL